MEDKKKTLDNKKVSLRDIKNSKDEKRIILSTGFRNLDTVLGYRVYDENTNELIKTNRGILSGSKITIVGVTHAGKSTLAVQIAANMIRPWVFKNDTRAKIHVFDTEFGVNRERIRMLHKFSHDQSLEHVVFEEALTVSGIKKCIQRIIDEKESKDYEMSVAENHSGRDVLMYPPSIVLIDSISALITDNIEDLSKDTTNTMYMQVAGEIDRFVKQYSLALHKYNITMITVAHVGTEFDISAMPGQRPKRKWKYLPAGFKIKAPSSMLYGCDIGLYFDSIIAKDKDTIANGRINAAYLDANAISSAVVYKSRQTGEGGKIYLVQDTKGFDPLKSLVYECQILKILKNTSGQKELDGYGKIPNKEVISKFGTDSKFRQSLFLEYDKYHNENLESNRLHIDDINVSNDIYNLLTEDI